MLFKKNTCRKKDLFKEYWLSASVTPWATNSPMFPLCIPHIFKQETMGNKHQKSHVTNIRLFHCCSSVLLCCKATSYTSFHLLQCSLLQTLKCCHCFVYQPNQSNNCLTTVSKIFSPSVAGQLYPSVYKSNETVLYNFCP